MPKVGPLALVVAASSLTLAASADDVTSLFQRSAGSSRSEADWRPLPGGWLSSDSGLFSGPAAGSAVKRIPAARAEHPLAGGLAGVEALPFTLPATMQMLAAVEKETAAHEAADLKRVKQCRDISSSLHCHHSSTRYNLTCAGWTGKACVERGQEATCLDLVSEDACKRAGDFGTECAGWGGESCLKKGASLAEIRSERACQHSTELLGMPSGGWWSGTACLPAGSASCGSITLRGACNDAPERMGMKCAWSGGKCLSPQASCGSITLRGVCDDALERLGMKCGWSGDRCLSPQEATCEKMSARGGCSNAARSFGLKCAWSSEKHSCTTRPAAAAQPAEQPHETRLAASG